MTGSPITVASISQTLSSDLYDSGDSSSKSRRSAPIIAELLYTTGRIVLFCLKAFMLVIAIVLSLIVLFAGIAFIAFIIGLLVFNVSWEHPLVLPLLLPLIILLPTATIVYLILRWLFKAPKRDKTFSILTGIWILILIYFGIALLKEYPKIESWLENNGIEWYFERFRQQNSSVIDLPENTTGSSPIVTPTVTDDSITSGSPVVTTAAPTASDTIKPETNTELLTN